MRTLVLFCMLRIVADGAELVSLATGSISQTAAGSSYAPVISSDGRYVAFTSSARNLVTNDPGRELDLFVRDLQKGETRLVSAGPGNSAYASFSGDGQLLAYAAEVEGISHIFVYDQRTGSSTQLTSGSLASPNGPPPTGSSRPMLTTDGRWVLFESTATNLTSEPDTNGLPDLFLRDISSGSNVIVSIGAVPRIGSHLRQSFQGAITPTGTHVVFVSRNVPAPTTSTVIRSEVFVYQVQDGSITWASTNVESIVNSTGAEYVC